MYKNYGRKDESMQGVSRHAIKINYKLQEFYHKIPKFQPCKVQTNVFIRIRYPVFIV